MTILDEVNGFLDRTGMTISAFGQAVNKDTSYISKLRNGHLRLTDDRIAMLRRFMADNHDLVYQPRSAHRPVASGSGVNVEQNPDLWERDAMIGSAMLRDAMFRYYAGRQAA